MRVFFAERAPKFNLEDAKRFGKFRYVLEQHVSPLGNKNLPKIINEAFSLLSFDPNKDYLCLTGQAIIVPLVLAVAYRRYGSLKLLIFDARSESYVSIPFGGKLTSTS